MAGGCGRDSGEGAAQAEDGCARRASPVAAAAGKSFSSHLGAQRGGAGSAATVEASAHAGADAHAGEKPVAAYCAEPGAAEETEAVDSGGARVVAGTGAGWLDGAAAGRSVAPAGIFGKADRGTGPGSEDGGGTAGGSAVADDASGSGAGGGFGHGVDAGRSRAIS